MAKHLFNRKNWILTLAILVIAAGITLLIQSKAQADDITFNGRTETAQCETSYTDPAITTCVSESWICTIMDGSIDCQVKR